MAAVSVLGAGNMGAAIVRALLAAGVEVAVWNRTPDKVAPLAREGAISAASAMDAAVASPLTIAMVSDYRAVAEMFAAEPDGDRGAGRTILNLTTGRPEDVAHCMTSVRRLGFDYLDGAVSGHPEDIARETSQVLVSGSEQQWSTHREHIELLAGRVVYLGDEPVGMASALDLAMSGCFQTVTLSAFIEAAAYAAAFGIDAEVLRPQAIRLLDKMKLQIDALATAISTRSFTTDQATLDVYLAALDQVSSSMREVSVPARLTGAAADNMRPARERGVGGHGLAVHYEDLRGR